MTPALSIVIPAFDEEARIGKTLAEVCAWLDARGMDYELLVADDGSRDRTGALVKEHAATNPRIRLVTLPRNQGKGAAVRAGVLASRGAEVLFCDADHATPIAELEKLRAALAGGHDVAIGSRALPGADIRVRQHPVRELMGKTFNRLVQTLLLAGFQDTQCGFKLFRGDVARTLFAASQVDGFAFDVEILRLARQGQLRIAEVPVAWRHVDESKVSPCRDAARMFWDLLRLRLR